MTETAESRRIMQLEARVIDLMAEVKEVREESDRLRETLQYLSGWSDPVLQDVCREALFDGGSQ